MGLGFWGLNVLLNLPRPAVWHGGLEPEEYSLRTRGLPPPYPLSAVTGQVAPGAHTLPPRTACPAGSVPRVGP